MGQLRTEYFLVAFRGFCSTTFIPPSLCAKVNFCWSASLWRRTSCLRPLSTSPQGVSTPVLLLHTLLSFSLRPCLCATLGFCVCLCFDLQSPCTQMSWLIKLLQEITSLIFIFSILFLHEWQSQGSVVPAWTSWLRVSDALRLLSFISAPRLCDRERGK